MPKRHVNDNLLRVTVIARKAKGWAFMAHDAGHDLLDRVKKEITPLTRKEIFNKYPEYTYDLKP